MFEKTPWAGQKVVIEPWSFDRILRKTQQSPQRYIGDCCRPMKCYTIHVPWTWIKLMLAVIRSSLQAWRHWSSLVCLNCPWCRAVYLVYRLWRPIPAVSLYCRFGQSDNELFVYVHKLKWRKLWTNLFIFITELFTYHAVGYSYYLMIYSYNLLCNTANAVSYQVLTRCWLVASIVDVMPTSCNHLAGTTAAIINASISIGSVSDCTSITSVSLFTINNLRLYVHVYGK